MNWDRTIFLAHASEDKELVRDLYQRLKDHSLQPWLDKKNISAGEEWDNKIHEAIRKSRFFLACLSERSVTKRGYIQRELRIALSIAEEMPPNKIYFIPGLLEAVEIPDIRVGTINLKSYQYVKLYDTNQFHQLVEKLKNEMGLSQQVIYQEARKILEEVGLGILDKADQFKNEIASLRVLAVKSFKSGNLDKAHEYLNIALKIDPHDKNILLNLGRLYKTMNWRGHNPIKMFDMFNQAAESGSLEAKTELGNCYLEGFGVKQDYSKAYELFREASEQGYSPANSLLGLLYLGGKGIPKDIPRGIDLITKAAELGDYEAQSTLSMIYDTGAFGIKADKKKAIEWAVKAANQGDEASIKYLDDYSKDAQTRFQNKI